MGGIRSVRNGTAEKIPVEQVQVNDILIVKPGKKSPLAEDNKVSIDRMKEAVEEQSYDVVA
jgi:hypothetical protein